MKTKHMMSHPHYRIDTSVGIGSREFWYHEFNPDPEPGQEIIKEEDMQNTFRQIPPELNGLPNKHKWANNPCEQVCADPSFIQDWHNYTNYVRAISIKTHTVLTGERPSTPAQTRDSRGLYSLGDDMPALIQCMQYENDDMQNSYDICMFKVQLQWTAWELLECLPISPKIQWMFQPQAAKILQYDDTFQKQLIRTHRAIEKAFADFRDINLQISETSYSIYSDNDDDVFNHRSQENRNVLEKTFATILKRITGNFHEAQQRYKKLIRA